MSAGERGEMSLTGVLTACVLLVVVLGASLGMFEGFIAKASDATRRTDSEDRARAAVDRVTRDLRNLSSPTADQPQAVDVAGPSDLVFKTVNPTGPASVDNPTNTKRVRVCLDPRGRLQQQTQTWTIGGTPAVPSLAGCPAATGWTRTTIIASNVVNGTVPVFTYDSSVLTDISQLHLELLIDDDAQTSPPATRLSTGVFLRNQNRRPTATFTASRIQGGFVLNGSASSDPEGDTLQYTWKDGATQIGTGITFTWTGVATGSHSLTLTVSDPTGLTGTSPAQVVTG